MPEKNTAHGESTEARTVAPGSTILLVVERPALNEVINSSAILVEGFAVAVAGIEAIVVKLGDIIQFATLGIHRDDLANAFPSHPPLATSGFSCEINCEQLAKTSLTVEKDALPLSVTARDRKGHEQTVHNKLQLSRAGSTSSTELVAEPITILHVDEKLIDRRGLLRVMGWVVSHSPIEAVDVLVGSELIGSSELGNDRPDVALAWPQFANAGKSGFLFITDAASFFPESPQQGLTKQISVIARSVGGASRQETFSLGAPNYVARRKSKEINEFYCDCARLTKNGNLSLEGWAVSSTAIEKLRMLFEGETVGFAELGKSRPDVGNKFPTVAHSRTAGFTFKGNLDPAKVKGEHAICVEVMLSDGSIRQNDIIVTVVEASELPVPVADADEIQLNIDEPIIVDGRAARLVESTFAITGWAIAKSGIASIDFELDERPIGAAYCGIRREDVAKAFPRYGWNNALLSGFAFSLPHRLLTERQHQVALKIKAKSNAGKVVRFEINVGPIGEQPGPWTLRDRLPAAELLFAERLIDQLEFRPTLYIWVNCRRNNLEFLSATLASISAQLYQQWRLVITGDAKLAPSAAQTVRDQFRTTMPRVACFPIAAELEKLAAEAQPRDLVLLLDAGDVLAADALFEFAVMLNQSGAIDFIYADERRPNVGTNREDAYFKPDWSPTLLLASNYIGRPWCATVALFLKIGRRPFRRSVTNFDSVLHLTDAAAEVAHVPRILARRGKSNIETQEAETRALIKALKRRRLPWSVEPGRVPHTYRCRPRVKIEGLVSIIIPTCASRGLIRTCVESLRDISTYKNIEVICIDNIADCANEWKAWLNNNCDIVVEINEKFNWSRFNNVAAQEASGSYLLFLNDDIEVTQPDWLEAMLEPAQREDVGVVGPQLLYPDRKVQHAGMFLADRTTARHSFRFCGEDEPGYFGLALTQRDVIAVTGACMLVKKQIFEDIGGFDEAHSVINNDLDFCLKVIERNLRCVYTPFACLIHHELASRKDVKDEHDGETFDLRWGSRIATGDPYFHPALDRNSDSYQPDPEPTEMIFAGHPAFHAETIQRILAVKVDHIGDFVTAFPAFRRLKALFPHAELVALVAPASKHLAYLEPSIDRVISHEFFHANSQLGKKEDEADSLNQLKAKLASYPFDLAIDLRKHPDTRILLQYTGARLLAGFNHHNKFPWLDIDLTWEGDVQLVRKHQHVSDDLVNLVQAVAAAGQFERDAAPRSKDWSVRQILMVSRLQELGLYQRRLVCLHPASGNVMRQWPPRHFARIANALLATEDVDIALIGGPDEAEIATEVRRLILNSDRVYNLIGKFKLEELPYFLETCALFIGNNSGPKHIAAAVGIPTIGVHSGVVDAREWGPIGTFAVAAQRNMTCGPCYLATPDQCHRGLACVEMLRAAHVVSMCKKLLRLRRGIQLEGSHSTYGSKVPVTNFSNQSADRSA